MVSSGFCLWFAKNEITDFLCHGTSETVVALQSFQLRCLLHFGEGTLVSIPTSYCAFEKTNTNHNYEHPCALEGEKKNSHVVGYFDPSLERSWFYIL